MKYTSLLFFLLCLGTISEAQIALRGGVNYSDVSIEGTNVMTESKIGFHAGLQGNIGIGTVLGLRPALLYNIKGAKVDDTGASTSSSLHYIEVPLNLAFRFGLDDLALILEGGPYFGYLLNSSEGLFNDIDKSDWGVNFGAVIDLSSIGIGVNYSNSLIDVEGGERLNQAFQLTNGNFSAFLYFKF
ncbi:MAG: porin family protein [Bacteroidota bacterium]